jgi:NAD(P)-dependent dehydrogenase (short-subunit alcohol dehydrogenase family)
MQQFDGRVAVITGAASGIGRGLARKAAREGMKVALVDIEAVALDETAAEVDALGAEHLIAPVDVTSQDAMEELAGYVHDRLGSFPHLLCNNAGVFQAGVMWQRTQADWDWVFGVNVWGVLNGIRAFVPKMIEQGDEGHVVNTASMAGMLTVAYSSPYVVSKFAAAAMTECLAHDLRAAGSSIGVSCLVPGTVDTRIADSTRNRPDEPPSEAQAPDHYFVADILREKTANEGRHPDEVADMVFDAVRAEQFWIPTTDRYEELLQPRIDAMLARNIGPSVEFD